MNKTINTIKTAILVIVLACVAGVLMANVIM